MHTYTRLLCYLLSIECPGNQILVRSIHTITMETCGQYIAERDDNDDDSDVDDESEEHHFIPVVHEIYASK